jgi:hypothetical protein
MRQFPTVWDGGKEEQWFARSGEVNEPSNEPGSYHAAGLFAGGLRGVDEVLHAELRRHAVLAADGQEGPDDVALGNLMGEAPT